MIEKKCNSIQCWINMFNSHRNYHFDKLVKSFIKLNSDNELCKSKLKSFYDYQCNLLNEFDSDSIILLCLSGIDLVETSCEDFENALRMILEINATLSSNRVGKKITQDDLISIGAALNSTQDFFVDDFKNVQLYENGDVSTFSRPFNQKLNDHYKKSIKFRKTKFGEENAKIEPYLEKFKLDYQLKFGIDFSNVVAVLNYIEKNYPQGICILPSNTEYCKILEPYCMTGKKVYCTYNILKNEYVSEEHYILPYVYDKRLESTYVTPFVFLSDGRLAISYKMFKDFWTGLQIYNSFNRFIEFRNFVSARHLAKSNIYARDLTNMIKKKYHIISSNFHFSINNIKGEIDCIFIDEFNVIHLVELKYFEKGFSTFQIYSKETAALKSFSDQIKRYYLFTLSDIFQKIQSENNATKFIVDFVSYTPIFFYNSKDISTENTFTAYWFEDYIAKYKLE